VTRPSLLTLATAVVLLTPAAAPARAEEGLERAWRSADAVADAVVLVEYVLAREGRGFGSGGQRAELSAAGVVATAGGLVLLSDNVFPEEEGASRAAARPTSFVVRLADGSRVPAELAGRDEELGLAFLQLQAEGPFRHARFEKAPELGRGAPLLVASLLPERYGHQASFHRCAVSAVLREPRLLYDLDWFVQDASIGSPVLDGEGRVIGLVVIDRFENGGPSSAGPALPLDLISTVTRGKATGYPVVLPAAAFLGLLEKPPAWAPEAPRKRSWLGITLQEVDPKLADYLGIEGPTGILVTSVWEGSPADRAGLRQEDVIVRFAGRPVVVPDDEAIVAFIDRVQTFSVGDEIELELWRDGKRRTLRVTLGEAPVSAVQADEYRSEALGLVAQDLTMDIIQSRGWPTETRGALVSDLEMAGAAMVGGLEAGDLILAVDGGAVSGVDDLRQALEAALQAGRAEIVFFVLRDPDTLFVVVQPQR
jgi:serine protease Do